jgi:Short C-terminal domain
MMMRRRGGVGLLGVAAVAGVAHHAGSQAAQGQAQEQAQNQQIAELQAQQAAAAAPVAAAPVAAPAAAAPAGGDLTAQLQQLAALHTAGVLSDEEFAAGKAKLLAGG